ncbi:hypothetical protein V500_06044 [Pseudogymnoascus sp. VKM F-4518 (FW-2643)]|nr:hypothetical protein V500_06044 [Pseudogymnoascus sp. VKM F-4518 (FW-2643)]
MAPQLIPRFSTIFLLFAAFLLHHVAAYTPLSDATLKNLPSPGTDFDIHTGALLAPILIPRVPGSDGSTKVLNHFVDFFKTHLPKWTIAFQNSTSKTPGTGSRDVPFVNLILTRDPPWAQPGNVGHLALVAHYDSKVKPEGFIGATDSAAPCAMIMHAARSVDEALTRKWEKMVKDGVDENRGREQGLQILLLDGEEAFVEWTATDSLYGARSLAEAMHAEPHPALSVYRTPLHSISLFMLLDLLGAPSPAVPSYWKTTHWAYKHMATLESRLRSPAIATAKSTPPNPFLVDADKNKGPWLGPQMQDDHVPFLQRGVEILHLIPQRFPDVWHKITDDGEHLDSASVEDWAMITTAFVAEWMDLEGFFPAAAKKKVGRSEEAGRKTEL